MKNPPPIALACRLGGEFRMRVVRADGSIKTDSGWFGNLITDIGLDRLAQGAIAAFCRVGTGNSAPAAGNTALDAGIGSTSSTSGQATLNAGAPNYETLNSQNYLFALGAVVGNVAEVGVGWAATGTTLFSRALIVDGVGTPTTITVLVTEQLQVSYRLTVYPSVGDTVAVLSIGGVATTCTARAASIAGGQTGWLLSSAVFGSIFTNNVLVYNGALGPITGLPAGASVSSIANMAFAAYTPGSHFRDLIINWGVADGNVAGAISALSCAYSNSSGIPLPRQVGFAPALPKTNAKTLSLTLRYAWARH